MNSYHSYPSIQQSLSESHAMSEAAEAHGALAGALCASGNYQLGDWLAELLPEGATGGPLRQTLGQIYSSTRQSLAERDLSFDLLLPGDGQSIEARTEALGLWCNGFLYGLGTGGACDPSRLPAEAGEFVRDLAEIARAGVVESDGEEANESAWAEIVEYVRAGVQLVYEELGPLREMPRPERAALH